MNRGELDELKAALSLIFWRDNQLNSINNVGFYRARDYLEYYEYGSHDLNLDQISLLNEQDTVTICQECEITKAPSTLKADICINQINVSLKSHRGQPPALINHTNRKGIKQVCDRQGILIEPLDRAIDNYWQQRESGMITEDVDMCTPGNPFAEIKQDLIPILAYFLFMGTGQADSRVKANKLIEFTDPTDYNTWVEHTKEEAAEKYIDSIRISMRSKKGMPTNYNHNGTSEEERSIAKWTRFINGGYRGALHIRALK